MPAAAAKPKNMNEALLVVQKAAVLLDLPKTGFNPHHKNKYMPLDVVLGQVVPLLNNNGFILIQSPTVVGADGPNPQAALTTRFIYVPTGEELTDTALLCPGRIDPQGQGAAITYLKRYTIMSILGLTSDEDDDGNSSSRSTKPASVVTVGTSNGEAQTVPADDGDDPFASSSDSPF